MPVLNEPPPFAPVALESAVTGPRNEDFERRWAAWEARGVASERAARRRFVLALIVVAAITLAALIVYNAPPIL